MMNRVVLLLLLFLSIARAHAQSTRPTDQAASLRQRGEPVALEQLITWPKLPDERNGAIIVHSLVQRMRQGTPEGGSWSTKLRNQRLFAYALPLGEQVAAELREALAPQQEVLATLDRLCDVDGFDWGRSLPTPLASYRRDNPFPFGAFWGAGYRQLYLDGLLALHERDDKRAWRRVRGLQRLAEGFTSYPGDYDMGPLWPMLHEVTAALATAAATGPDIASGLPDRAYAQTLSRLWLDDRPLIEAYLRFYRLQRAAVLDAHAHLAAGTAKFQDFELSGYEAGQLVRMKLGPVLWPHAVDLHTLCIDTANAHPKLTDRGLRREVAQRMQGFVKGDLFARQVAANLGPGVETFIKQLQARRATQTLAGVAIAVRLYRMDHDGAWPASLEALTPKYLPAAPVDPLDTEAGPIRYRPVGHESIAWSSGEDGQDDGGKPTDFKVPLHQRKGMDQVVRLSVPLKP